MEHKSQQRYQRFDLESAAIYAAPRPSLQGMAAELADLTTREYQQTFSAGLDWSKSTAELIADYQREIDHWVHALLFSPAFDDPRSRAEVEADRQDAEYAATINSLI